MKLLPITSPTLLNGVPNERTKRTGPPADLERQLARSDVTLRRDRGTCLARSGERGLEGGRLVVSPGISPLPVGVVVAFPSWKKMQQCRPRIVRPAGGPRPRRIAPARLAAPLRRETFAVSPHAWTPAGAPQRRPSHRCPYYYYYRHYYCLRRCVYAENRAQPAAAPPDAARRTRAPGAPTPPATLISGCGGPG